MTRRRPSPRGPGLVLRHAGAGGSGWGARLTGAFEGMLDAERMRRGRAVARSGQVLSLGVSPGRVHAAVQGSQPDPFETVLTVRELDRYDRAEVAAQVRAEPGMLTALASGSVPASLAERLVPADTADIDFECTCPDPGWPCKHGVAVALLAAQEFDARPMRLLTWRGVEVDMLIEAVAEGDGADTDGAPGAAAAAPDAFAPPRPLPPQPAPGEEPALEILDTAALRAALRLWGDDTGPAEAELARMYRRIARGGG